MARRHKSNYDDDKGPYPFAFCVNDHDCNPSAHGGVKYIEGCNCGAERQVNVCMGHQEPGRWQRKEVVQ